ncbi:MAG: ATP-dependent metallopeptidase FtsH/Yme1/Tma family protein, partial [Actinomycetota bacterium]
MNRIFRSAIFYLVLIIAVVWVFNLYRAGSNRPLKYESVNTFKQDVEEGRIVTAEFLNKDEKISGDLSDGGRYEVSLPTGTVPDMAEYLEANDVEYSADPQQGSVFLSVLFQFLPILLIIGFFFFLMQQMQGGGNRVMSFGKSKARL